MLNKKWAELNKNGEEEENMGPLGAKKKNILKETEKTSEEITLIQKEWIANQTVLIKE